MTNVFPGLQAGGTALPLLLDMIWKAKSAEVEDSFDGKWGPKVIGRRGEQQLKHQGSCAKKQLKSTKLWHFNGDT